LQIVIDQVIKESSCHNPKMVAYCQEVRKLEDKFDGLELNHIPRWLNEAVDELAKMASNQEPVPTDIFTNDQRQPSICYEELEQADNESPISSSRARADNQLLASRSMVNPPMDLPDPGVMEIDEDPSARPNPLLD
jgi:hypothetical protein